MYIYICIYIYVCVSVYIYMYIGVHPFQLDSKPSKTIVNLRRSRKPSSAWPPTPTTALPDLWADSVHLAKHRSWPRCSWWDLAALSGLELVLIAGSPGKTSLMSGSPAGVHQICASVCEQQWPISRPYQLQLTPEMVMNLSKWDAHPRMNATCTKHCWSLMSNPTCRFQNAPSTVSDHGLNSSWTIMKLQLTSTNLPKNLQFLWFQPGFNMFHSAFCHHIPICFPIDSMTTCRQVDPPRCALMAALKPSRVADERPRPRPRSRIKARGQRFPRSPQGPRRADAWRSGWSLMSWDDSQDPKMMGIYWD